MSAFASPYATNSSHFVRSLSKEAPQDTGTGLSVWVGVYGATGCRSTAVPLRCSARAFFFMQPCLGNQRLGLRCSCASNCAHLHSPTPTTHPPTARPAREHRVPESRRSSGARWTGRRGGGGRGGQSRGRVVLTVWTSRPFPLSKARSLAARVLLLPPSCSLARAAPQLSGMHYSWRPPRKTHVYASSVCCVCIYFNWIPRIWGE